LNTKLNNEADWHFTDFDDALRDVDRQVKMAAALTELSRRLSPQNRDDLRVTRSTLAADGSLQKGTDLYPVDSSIQERLWRSRSNVCISACWLVEHGD
jgi:hypothetical protein